MALESIAPTDSKDPLGPLALLVLKAPKVLPAPLDLSAARPDLRDQPDPLDLRDQIKRAAGRLACGLPVRGPSGSGPVGL